MRKPEYDVVEMHVRLCENGYLITTIYDEPGKKDPTVKRYVEDKSSNLVGARVSVIAADLYARNHNK